LLGIGAVRATGALDLDSPTDPTTQHAVIVDRGLKVDPMGAVEQGVGRDGELRLPPTRREFGRTVVAVIVKGSEQHLMMFIEDVCEYA
jgi:hypothetical protein